MNRACLVRLASVLSVWALVSAGRADDRFPKEGEENFLPKLKAAVAEIRPLPETPIPDDPPPHEGALIDIPYLIEPPDLLVVEVLEALPGRPISGQRLVRPDGTISLGFYGSVHLRGLTLEQAKVKIVEHLRILLPDHTLGLLEDEDEDAVENLPPGAAKASDLPTLPVQVEPIPVEVARQPVRKKHERAKPESPHDRGIVPKAIAPQDTNRVFVDVSAYNSKYYYVGGDVAAPGRMPFLGKETVLDALNYAGGFLATSDQGDVRLIRPARGGKPTKVYPIEFRAITEKGEKRQNLQVFPGDRIIVGRSATVQTTIYLDRMTGLFQSLIASLQQASSMTQQRAALLKEWFEVVWRASNQPGGPTPDEATFRDMLLLQLKAVPRPAKPTEKK